MREFFKAIRKLDVIILILFMIVLLFLDQYTKHLTTANLQVSESKKFIDGFLRFTYVRNEGASFGILQGQKVFFVLLTCIILPLMLFIYFKISGIINVYSSSKNKLKFSFLNIAILLVFIGAIGNFIDRLRFSYVVDFLEVEFIDFPVFNLADCYVTVGTAIVFVILFLLKDNELDMILKPKRKWEAECLTEE